jgi:hypothetical protein
MGNSALESQVNGGGKGIFVMPNLLSAATAMGIDSPNLADSRELGCCKTLSIAFALDRQQGHGTISEQVQGNQAHDPERRILPAATHQGESNQCAERARRLRQVYRFREGGFGKSAYIRRYVAAPGQKVAWDCW